MGTYLTYSNYVPISVSRPWEQRGPYRLNTPVIVADLITFPAIAPGYNREVLTLGTECRKPRLARALG
jgi:hypothetical protein